jgi:hypothetical protein
VQLREEFNIDIRVLGIADSKHMLTSEGGIDLSNWREQWESNKQPSDLQVGGLCTMGGLKRFEQWLHAAWLACRIVGEVSS